MSDSEEPKITATIKTKDPRRVEAGRRLGLMSKAAKERKMRERILSENVIEENSNNASNLLVLGTALVVIAGGYYAYSKKSHTVEPKVEVEEPVEEKKSNLVNYFD